MDGLRFSGAPDYLRSDNGSEFTAEVVGGWSSLGATQLDSVPSMPKYRFPNTICIEGGVMLGLLYGATDEFINSVQEEDDVTYERNVRSAYHPLDAGAMVGVGYRLLSDNGVNLSVRYYHGLVDTFIDDSTPSRFNRSVYFSVGIPIGSASKE